MRQTALIYLHVTARLQLINCFKRSTSHELSFNTRFQHPSSLRATELLMPFTKEAASLHAKPAKHKLHLSAQSSLTIETRHFDALTHNLYFCAYSGL